MARRIVFFLVAGLPGDKGMVIEVSDLLTDCFDARRKGGYDRTNSYIDHEWVQCGGYKS